MIELDNVLHEQMRSFGAETYRKFLYSEVINNWSKLVDKKIAAQVKPVIIEHGVLFVKAENSAFKDQLKFFYAEILDAINETYKEASIKEIRIAKSFQVAAMLPEFSTAQAEEPKVKLEEITLTDEEIKHCEEQAANLPDEKLRQVVLQTLLSQVRVKKFRLANDWHKCAKCNALCPPQEMFCEVCSIKEREAMVAELFKIFYDAPWLKTREARKILLERMPYMRNEALSEAVESARTSLIQRIASQIRFPDENSPDVLKLVMLERQLPPDKLTPAIIRSTLYELRIDSPRRYK